MATERHPKHGEEGYEHADAHVRSLYKFGAVLAILIVAVMWAMVHTYTFLAKHESLGPPASPFENQRALPPQPRLQPHPATDLKRYCEMEQQQLRRTAGWTNITGWFASPRIARWTWFFKRDYPRGQRIGQPRKQASHPWDRQWNRERWVSPGLAAIWLSRQANPWNRNSGRIEVKLALQMSARVRGNSAWRAVTAAALLLSSPFFGAVAHAQFQYPTQNIDVRPELLKDVGIDQKLNNSIPLDLTFRDETGQTIKLAQFFGQRACDSIACLLQLSDALHTGTEWNGAKPERRSDGHRQAIQRCDW